MDEYFNKRIESHMDDIYRYILTNNKRIFSRTIYPVFPKIPGWLGKIWRFLFRKTKWKCFITGYECNGVFYDKHTPAEQMGPKEEPKPVEFRRYIPLSIQREETNMIELKELEIREVLELLELRRKDAWGEGEPYIEIDINEADAIIKALQNR